MINQKIKTLNKLKAIVSGIKRHGKVVVFTNGCFDLLHYGHAKYLEDAKRKGDILIVAVNSDASIKKIKGKLRPVISENNRLKLLAALESVDYLTLFKETTPLRLIRELKPDILIKGADWDKNNIVGSCDVLKRGGKIITIKLVKGLSTTNLIRKIAKKFS
ncbi:MAG: D-glycero-beta-D-manno-heptose 1-phosphate adenylyltransferase [Candidatus Omnitrophica bacterium]|nr:D-glycero-beta-D-manno-heptose 1-phosphate adenylyltransferase [Candidatus Omnitrophota bacterium]